MTENDQYTDGTHRQDVLYGEIEQTIATLRGEADELRERGGNPDIAGQLSHRADSLEAAYERFVDTDTHHGDRE